MTSYPAPQPEQPKKKGGCMKWGLIGAAALVIIGVFSSLGGNDDATTTDTTASSTSVTMSVAEESSADAAPVEASPEAEPASEAAGFADILPDQDVTREQRNALRKAESYLDFSGFSESGLRDQLEFEEFPQDAIDYAMASIEVDWNEQALKKAQSYDSFASMSDAGLYDQLIFEGFTPEQAQYGVDNL